MGSGTTCLAAKELNRSFIGIEKEVKYYDLAVSDADFSITANGKILAKAGNRSTTADVSTKVK